MKTPKNVHLHKRHGRQASLVRSLAAKVIFCPVVWSKPFSSGIGLPLCIYHFTGLEDHFPGSRMPPSLRQRLRLPPLCAFSLWFYDRSARLNSFFTYVKYITLPILWIQTTYNKSVYKYFSDDKQWESKRHALNPVCEGLHNLRWGAARCCLTSRVASVWTGTCSWSNSAILIIKMIGIIQTFYLKHRSVDTY